MHIAALCTFYPRVNLFVRDRNRRNSHFVGSTGFVLDKTLLGSAFLCELRLWVFTLFAFAITWLYAIVLGVSLSAESDKGRCPLDPCHPLKSVDVNFIPLRGWDLSLWNSVIASLGFTAFP